MRRIVSLTSVAILLPLLGVACTSTDWEARYLEREQENFALQEQYDSLNHSYAEREASAEVLRKELSDTEAEIDVLSDQMVRIERMPVQETVVFLNAPGNDAAELEAEIERLRSRNLDASLTPDGNIEIRLDADVTFKPGSYALNPEGKKIVDLVAEQLTEQFPSNLIRVVGHTDSDPIRKSPFKDNLELGAERACEVIRYLSQTHGIEGSRLVAASRGDTAPLVENVSKESKRTNRRVEIVVVIPRRDILGAARK